MKRRKCMKGIKTNVNVYIAEIVGKEKKLIKSGSVKKYVDGGFATTRFTKKIQSLKFDKGQKYYVRIRYSNNVDNVNDGYYTDRKEMLIAWDAISSKENILFFIDD